MITEVIHISKFIHTCTVYPQANAFIGIRGQNFELHNEGNVSETVNDQASGSVIYREQHANCSRVFVSSREDDCTALSSSLCTTSRKFRKLLESIASLTGNKGNDDDNNNSDNKNSIRWLILRHGF